MQMVALRVVMVVFLRRRGVYRPADKPRLCPDEDRRKRYRSLFCKPLDI
jgi:hypothetical protein